jgi:ComF family protein
MDFTPIAKMMCRRLRSSWQLFLAICTEENCRLCRRSIDQLGWLVRRSAFGEESRYVAPSAWIPGACRDHVDDRGFFEMEPSKSFAVCADCWTLFASGQPTLTRYALSRSGLREMSASLDGDTDFLAEHEKLFVVASGIGYYEHMKKLIRRYKYDKDTILTADLSWLLLNGWGLLFPFLEPGNILIVPVPLHWRRKRERGYNQSALVAQRAARILKLRMSESALVRCKFTRPQNKLTKEAREENLARAFKGNRKILKGKDVVLIDDVCTSGATLAECAKEAYECGARVVYGLTIARAILVHKRSIN